MITEDYKITKTNSELDALLEDGDNQLKRVSLGLPEVTRKENSQPFKFRKATKEEMNVFKVLFPSTTKIEDYKDFVPNEVLDLLQEFKDTCPHRIFKIEVMHPEEYDPDPVLVAHIRDQDDDYSFANAVMIIARWGDSLMPFDELKEKATERWIKARASTLRRIRREAELGLEELESLDLANVNSTSIPYTSGLTIS